MNSPQSSMNTAHLTSPICNHLTNRCFNSSELGTHLREHFNYKSEITTVIVIVINFEKKMIKANIWCFGANALTEQAFARYQFQVVTITNIS